jgi:hypothetical protein
VERAYAVAEDPKRMPEARRVRATRDETHDLAARRDELLPTDIIFDSRAQRSALHGEIVRPVLRDYCGCTSAMAGSDDTYLVDTSIGQLTVQYGWNRWVSISGRGTAAHKAVVASRGGLDRLLIQAGVPELEARRLAKRLWGDRPGHALRRGDASPWESPWKQHPVWSLMLFLLLFALMATLVVVLQLDIIFF